MNSLKTKTEKVYIAGPMRGYPEYNYPAFIEAAKNLREQGYEVSAPHEIDIDLGRDAREVGEKPLAEYMADDLPEVCRADLLVLLPGWQESEGTKIEVDVALALDIPIRLYKDMT